jgi:hypothetical protein
VTEEEEIYIHARNKDQKKTNLKTERARKITKGFMNKI